ncbi:hypothetical protein [Flavihumibacter petaseus]|uniref:DUF4199 domain-containing protein n=1 Tax=Flavihumibacter petaseus NBRC 106054 TaxID=1220578 RepID=A0A0E9N4S4_9BACT|nr:hypothetical protein [Flavihumibacter petaseus]GAO44834.1 hypothetical protein FPE01S_04_00770 [Flavihumibacter petaseus NBRC 106054]
MAMILYRILTYTLLIAGALFAMAFLSTLMLALANPILLLPVFVIGCLLIYTYTSWRFLSKAIDAHQYCKRSLRDLIRVNGFVSLFLGCYMLIVAYMMLFRPEMLDTAIDQAISMQKTTVEGMEDAMRKTIPLMAKLMLTYAIVLITHIFITFRLIRQHADAFDE